MIEKKIIYCDQCRKEMKLDHVFYDTYPIRYSYYCYHCGFSLQIDEKEPPVIEIKGGDTIILENDCLLTRRDIMEGDCILKAENNHWKCRVNKIIPMGGELKLVCADFMYYSDDGETWTAVYKNEM